MTSTPSVSGLFQSAASSGAISQEALKALTVLDIGAKIQAAMGVPALNIPSSEVVLLSLLVDDSGSISSAGNTEIVCEGHNLVLDAQLEAKVRDNILCHTRYLNGQILFPYCQLEHAPRMDPYNNYYPEGGTPLYDHSVLFLGTVLAKAQEFEDNGIAVRTISLIVTDGDDTASRRFGPADVCRVVEDMLRSENHLIFGMGIADGHTDFVRVFQEMGIPKERILTPGSDKKEIRADFRTFSKSVSGVISQSNSGRTSMGGFASP